MRRTLTLALTVVALTGCFRSDPLPAEPRPRPIPERDGGQPPHSFVDAAVEPPGEVVVAETPPPPISGGTLAVTADGARIVAADPELDTLSIIDTAGPTLRATVAFEPGDEPGRIALDGAGRAHVVLRSAGAIASIDLETATIVSRRAVCAVPRGIAWRESDDTLHVACAEGLLVSLPAAAGEPTRRVRIADDLRDVVIRGDELYVTRFREARLLRIDASGAAVAEHRPTELDSELLGPMRLTSPGPFQPAVAWRAIPTADGVVMIHQRALSAEFPAEGGYGAGDCASIVHGALTEVGGDGAVRSSTALGGAILPVDVAIAPGGDLVAVAAPAGAYPRARGFGEPSLSARMDVLVYSRTAISAPASEAPCVSPSVPLRAGASQGAATAVAFLPDGHLVIQTRAPAQVIVQSVRSPEAGTTVLLSGESTYDTGHMLFHAATGGGIACASCHPEGGDDARTWRFFGIGPRRTQTMRGGLLGTAPFHWDGDMADFDVLLHHVFEGRMGGGRLAPAEAEVFGRWMDTLPALPRPEVADAARVERGRVLFHDSSVGCATCHAGAALTSNVSVDVGTGAALQVPTLLGIAYRAPYMHDGCAPTLRDRFGACGGGDRHGRTSDLSEAQLDDLVAYLETL